MRSLLKTFITLGILVVTIGGVYYVYRARTASREGESYAITSVPRDLLRDVQTLFAPGDTTVPPRADTPSAAGETAEAETPGIGPDATKPADDRTRFERATEHYNEARFADAEPLLVHALSTPGASSGRPAELLAQTRLFLLLLENTEPGSALEGPPVGYIVMQNGRPLLVQVTEDTPDEIAFRAPGGIQSSVKKTSARSVTVGHTREKKRAIFEREYRFRHDTARTADDFLALGRFSSECGLTDHVTYCLERAIEKPGDGVQDALTKMYSTGRPERQELVREMLRRFYPKTDVSARLYKPDVSRQPVAEPKKPAVEEPGERTSGIGGTGERKIRAPNDEVAALLAKAEEHRKVGDEYYRKAFAGGTKATDHRDKALAAYRRAQEIYESVEKQWNVGLDRTFKDIQTRVYDLLKSIR